MLDCTWFNFIPIKWWKLLDNWYNVRYHIILSIGGENQGQKVAAATYLKNFTRQSINDDGALSKVSKEFKEHLLQALLQVEPVVLKVLVEAVCIFFYI